MARTTGIVCENCARLIDVEHAHLTVRATPAGMRWTATCRACGHQLERDIDPAAAEFLIEQLHVPLVEPPRPDIRLVR